jgi:hypothetical protein
MYVRGMGQLADACSLGSGSACSWYDDIWATQPCLDWYAQCDPTNAFYRLNTKGLIVGGAGVLGSTAADAVASAGNSVLGIDPTASGIPSWAWMAALIAAGVFLVPKLVGR